MKDNIITVNHLMKSFGKNDIIFLGGYTNARTV